LDDNEEFDPVAMSWTTKTVMPTPRATEHSVAVDSGIIYVIGGRTGATPSSGGQLSANEAYNPGTNTWATLAPLPTAVSDAAALSFGGKIYVFGGIGAGNVMQSLVQIYDIATNSWSAGAAMPTARGSLSGGICGSQMHLIGGVNSGFTNLSTHEVYDPNTNSWGIDTSIPIPISETQGVSSSGKIFLIGTGIFGAAGTPNQIWTCASQVIGGEMIPIETTSLILAGAQSFSWMIPLVLSVVGIGLFAVSRKSEIS